REHTDDAQIDADLVALPARVGGVVTDVKFADNEHVAQDQVLAVLEDDLPKARLAESEAQLAAAVAQAAAADADAAIAERTAVTQKSAAKATLYGASAGANQSRDQIGAAEAMARASEASVRQAELVFKRAEQLKTSGAITTSEYDAAKNALDGARANLDQAKANVAVVKTQTQSADSRVAEANAKYSQLSDVDAYILQAKSRAATAHAQVKTSEASRDRAKLDLSYTVIKAPRAGVLSKRTIAVGQNVAAGQAIATLLPDDALWVTANFKETQIGAMRAGQKVKLEIDAYSGRDFEGEVESFAAATGSRFALLPPDNASGNFTKVVQRVPVRIRIASPHGPELVLR
ncbi:MAG: HlyD family secretion protein, partial [Proteobacteria bacterium]